MRQIIGEIFNEGMLLSLNFESCRCKDKHNLPMRQIIGEIFNEGMLLSLNFES